MSTPFVLHQKNKLGKKFRSYYSCIYESVNESSSAEHIVILAYLNFYRVSKILFEINFIINQIKCKWVLIEFNVNQVWITWFFLYIFY